MQVHRNLDQLPLFRKAVVTIGTFDGVHLGHRQIIDKLKSEAAAIGGETVIITFHPHPRKVVSATHSVQLINTLGEKIELLEGLQIDHLVVVPFTDSFSSQEAREYVERFLAGRFHPHTIIIGYDHRFGRDRKGDYLLLEELAPIFNYRLKEIPKHVLDEISISSTRIRAALLGKDVAVANKLLDYEFFFSGSVVRGNQLGRKLGYPTANLEIADKEKIVPGDGIYTVHADLIDGNASKLTAQKKLGGMMSIGLRPTVDGKNRVIEVNLFDFSLDIYGRMLRVYVKKYLRDEVKFDSLDELVRQIDRDREESLRVLGGE